MSEEGFEIVVRARESPESGGTIEALYSVFIPNSDLDPHRKFNCRFYSPHDHLAAGGDSQRYCFTAADTIYKTSQVFRPSYTTIGSKVYALNYDNQLLVLDVWARPHDLYWKPIPSPAPISLTNIRVELEPTLLSLDGRLYLLGVSYSGSESESSGLIYDPEKDLWSELPELPTQDITSVPDAAPEIAVANSWSVHQSEGYMDQRHYGSLWFLSGDTNFREYASFIFRESVTCDEKEETAYWIDTLGDCCSYNRKTKDYKSGPIIGVENDDIVEQLLDNQSDIYLPLLHLEGDIFCIIYTIHSGDSVSDSTILHCLVCRIVKPEVFGAFALSVVGCFATCIPEILDVPYAYKVVKPAERGK